MEVKKRLAREIVGQLHGEPAAREAEEGFTRTFQRGELPDEVVTEYRVSFSETAEKFKRPVVDVGGVRTVDSMSLAKILHEAGLASSMSEARRLIRQGAIDIDGDVHTSESFALRDGLVFRVGKHRFLRIVDADGRAE
jgi:tyrosyl-tRNA synthetase